MINDTFEYKAWADERILEAVEGVNAVTFPDSYMFMLQQINHTIIVEDLFRSRLISESAPHEGTNTKVIPGYDELKERLLMSGKWYLNYVSNLRNEQLKAIINFTFADGKNGSMSMEEILFHIINHGSYHRGSIAHALDLAGIPHPPDGYGIFIHEAKPERRMKM